MKETIQLFLLIGLGILSVGCASPYMADRGRDVADIFTATVGAGAGAKARIGPIHAGLYAGLDAAGLRGGNLDTWSIHGCDGMGVMSLEGTVISLESFAHSREQGKDYTAFGVPLVSVVEKDDAHSAPLHSYYTQIEVAGGAIGTARLGFNPGELLDFILGWGKIDIYHDDLE